MAIEQLGESLLAQARQKTKKKQKKTKMFTGAMLGVLGANLFLRNKASKKIKEMNYSYAPLLTEQTRHFNEGVDFWDKHNKLLGKEFAPEQYADAIRARELKKIKAEYTGMDFTDFKNARTVRDLIEERTKDDIAAEKAKIEAYSQFKHYKDDKESRVKYLSPIQDMLTDAQKKITKNSNVGSVLLKALGLKKKDHLDGILTGDTFLNLPEGADRTLAQRFAKMQLKRSASLTTVEEGTNNVEYGIGAVGDQRLAALFKDTNPLNFKHEAWVNQASNDMQSNKSGDDGKYNSVSITLPDIPTLFGEKDKTYRFYEIVDMLQEHNKGTDVVAKFQDNYVTAASILSRKYTETGTYKDQPTILKEALDIVSKNLTHDPSLYDSFSYVPFTNNDFGFIVEGKPEGYETGRSYVPNENDVAVYTGGQNNQSRSTSQIDNYILNSSPSTKKYYDGLTEDEQEIFRNQASTFLNLNTNVPTIQRADDDTISTLKEDQEPSWLQDILDGKNYTIKPEKIEELRKLSDENVKDFKSSYKSFVSNIESGASEMFNSIAKIDEDIISGELQRKLISSISKTIGPVLKGKTIPQQDFSDTIKVFARNNNIRLEDIVSALDYDWLYKSTGVKNRNIGRRERQAREDKIRKERLLLEKLQEQVKGTGTDPQTGMPSLLSPRLQKEALERRRLGLSDRGIL